MVFHLLHVKTYFIILLLGCFFSCVSQKKETINFPDYITKNYVMGKFDYTKNDGFIKVKKAHSSKEIYIRKEVYTAFINMANAAKKDGISYTIISGTRNFAHQKRIWDWKWNKKYKDLPPNDRIKKILEFSSMPSTSRHHWGTDIDLNNLENSYFEKGKGKKEYNWLVKNANRFGFYQVYTSKKSGRKGYHEEKWHWSYAPLSSLYLKYYNKHISYNDISDFKGAKLAKKLNMISDYVNGIDSKIIEYTQK